MSHTHEFFEELTRRGHEPLLQRVQATIRFEISDVQTDPADRDANTGRDRAASVSRLVAVDHGRLTVSADGGGTTAEATIACSASELQDLVNGRTSAMASLLRGALTVQGDPELVVLAQRLFSRHPAPTPDAAVHTGEGRPS
ncbi:hypothetical protein GCM10009740_05890 [Terrabacter terrae]|uniref:SCP2 domain-containing protein n=1 Tax=Terrabacter terrae TaxID=318434 RepID=A0ABN2TUA5_9MICO